jgi:succinoglycan biosynthesis protein ExoM
LKKLLDELEKQQTGGLFTYSVVVTDNDPEQSARSVCEALSSTSSVQLKYCVESQPNIAMARNKALENAEGEFAAFIDDDEFPGGGWLSNLYKTCIERGVDGVLGPVEPYFEKEPPQWVKKGGFFDRPKYVTGHAINWEQARTGNVLFKRSILIPGEPPFRVQFDTAGEDVDFFRRMMGKGCKFVWCNEAVVHELVPASRCNRSYLLRRALLRGSNFHKHPTHRLKNTVKSIVAIPCYLVALPVLAVFGQHLFLRYLFKLLDHTSRLLSFLGLRLVTERQS